MKIEFEGEPQHSNEGGSTYHAYPSWFENGRLVFLSGFNPKEISSGFGHVLRKPLYDAIGTGRRIRPALFCAFWKARTGEYPPIDVMAIAGALELFHAASIVVDDLADKEDARRNKIPLFLLHGEEIAVLVSHALVAAGYEQLSRSHSFGDITKLWTKSYTEACVGQSLDYRLGGSGSLREQQDLSLKKTEAFFGFAGACLDLLLKMEGHEAGFRAIGRVFQIGNDVLDFLNMDTSPRLVKKSHYPLRLSYLVPRLVDAGIVKPNEVFSTLPMSRLREITTLSRQHLIDTESIFSPELKLQHEHLLRLELDKKQIAMCEEFMRHCCQQSFWDHDHAPVT